MDPEKVCHDNLDGEWAGDFTMTISGASGTTGWGGAIDVTPGCDDLEETCNVFTYTFLKKYKGCLVVSEDGKSLTLDMSHNTYEVYNFHKVEE
jgi:hypothetical protein